MTAEEWFNEIDFRRHLRCLKSKKWLSPRQERLLGAAFCRAVLLQNDPRDVFGAVEAAEAFADGEDAAAELDSWRQRCRELAIRCREEWVRLIANQGDRKEALKWQRFHELGWAGSYVAAAPVPLQQIANLVCATADAAKLGDGAADLFPSPLLAAFGPRLTFLLMPPNEYAVERDTALRDLVLDVAGNPFDPVHHCEWRTSAATAIARGMHQSRDFSAMPILADALQDAGCDDERILRHCREVKTHVRGCWVVDLLSNTR